ncbi:MAG: potassium-transporting ATPase potassium-binding subunit, partial [Frankiales bacterium]|nr:potassium-transporting ATPase potassium-binding subunit [Frankiales bacterium]
MSDGAAGLLQALLLVAALAVCYRPMGDYMARVFEGKKHLAVERAGYRLMGVDPDADQTWRVYLRGVLAFSAVSVLFLYAFQRLQAHLPLSLGFPDVRPDTAWNTAASFVTNTNWQSYSGESTMGHLVQMAGLAVQNFASAAVGVAVAVALVRGFTRSRTERIGNFWVDLVRTNVRILLPLAILGTVVLVCAGVVQNLHAPHTIATLAGGHQTITGGPVASQESIKELGTNGGGFYNANSAHPFENPNALTNLLQIFLLLLIPVALTRTLGTMLSDRRQGNAVLAAMAVLWGGALALASWAETSGQGLAASAAGAALEG